MKSPTSLRKALRLHFVTVTVLPIMLLGFVGLQYSKQKHLETISSLVDSHALNIADEATGFLDETSSDLFLIAAMTNSEKFHGEDNIDRHLQAAIDTSKHFESIYVLDREQRIIHLALSEQNSVNRFDHLGLDMSSHEIFFARPTLEQPVWSDIFLSAVTVEPTITLGIPIPNGTLLGTVSPEENQ